MTDTSPFGFDFDFDTVVDRRDTDSHKWGKYRGADVIPLWVADMDFRSPPAVIAALQERVEHGVFGYADPPRGLEEAVRASLMAEYGWEVTPEWIVWLPGVVSGLNVLCRAVGAPGDRAATFTPIYPPFLSAPANAGRTVVQVPHRLAGSRWEMDLEALEGLLGSEPGAAAARGAAEGSGAAPAGGAALPGGAVGSDAASATGAVGSGAAAAAAAKTTLLLLCSPQNPLGRVWSAAELTTLAEIAEQHDLVIGSDEIHAGLVLDEDKPHIPIATLSPAIAARTITLMAPSKTFNIPGLGCSFAVISDPGLRAAFVQTMNGIVPHVNIMGYVAAQAAYEHGAEWHRALLAYLRENRDLVERSIAAMPGLSMTHVEATCLAWIDTSAAAAADAGRSDDPTLLDDPVGFFEKAGVGLSDGAAFAGPGYVRLNFGCSRALLTEALDRIRAALGG